MSINIRFYPEHLPIVESLKMCNNKSLRKDAMHTLANTGFCLHRLGMSYTHNCSATPIRNDRVILLTAKFSISLISNISLFTHLNNTPSSRAPELRRLMMLGHDFINKGNNFLNSNLIRQPENVSSTNFVNEKDIIEDISSDEFERLTKGIDVESLTEF